MLPRVSTSQEMVRITAFFVLPVLVFLWSEVLFSELRIHLAVVLGVAALVAAFVRKAGERTRFIRTLVLTAFVLSLVFAYEEGYFSRFWFLLYLMPIYIGFLYTPKEAFALLAGVMLAFVPSIGRVDVIFDIMSYVSLLLVIPLIVYLRDRYLVIRQSRKDILIIEESKSRIQDLDTISRLLANRVTSLGVDVRQALTYIKQASTALLQGEIAPSEQAAYLQRIRKRAVYVLDYMRKFEGSTSANVVLRGSLSKAHKLKK